MTFVRSTLKVLTYLSVILSLILFHQLMYFTFGSLNIKGDEYVLSIEKGQSLKSITNKLVAAELIDKPRFFSFLGRVKRVSKKLQAGEYVLPKGITGPELIEMLASGKVRQHSITLVEGWTFSQLKSELEKEPYIKSTITDLKDPQVLKKMGIAYSHPEGLFNPNTYFFHKGTTDLEFLKRAYNAQMEYLDKYWDTRAVGLYYKNKYQVLILASIIERESAVMDEYPLISQVYHSRLKIGMKLHADPTVIYGLGDNYKGKLTRNNLKTKTPYNTYLNHGLPPTPIAMPSKAAIKAALNPSLTDYLYFVAIGDGSHKFSKTFNEHKLAVDRYILKKNIRLKNRNN